MRLAFLLACTVAAAPNLPAADPPSVFAIRNARLVPVSGPVLPRATIVIRHGLIEDVGTNINIPADAWVIEGEGLNVYPGLVDALSTAGLPTAPPIVVPASGAVILNTAPAPRGPQDRPSNTSWKRAADDLRPTDNRLLSFRANGFTSAAVFPTQGLIAGQGAFINFGGEMPGQMVVASNAGQYMRVVSNTFRSFPGSRMGVMAYIRQLYIDLDYYQRQKKAYDADPRGKTRPAYDRALEGLAESPRILFAADRPYEIERIAGFARELGRPAILHGVQGAYANPAALKGLGVIVSTKWPSAGADTDPDAPQEMRDLEHRDNAPTTPAKLAAAGVKFAFTSDGQSAAETLRAIRKAMVRGLKPDDALRALTLSAAELYGLGDRLGSLDKGKIANLVVTKSDLLAERPEIQFVVVDGVKFAAVEPPAPRPGRGGPMPSGEEEENQ